MPLTFEMISSFVILDDSKRWRIDMSKTRTRLYIHRALVCKSGEAPASTKILMKVDALTWTFSIFRTFFGGRRNKVVKCFTQSDSNFSRSNQNIVCQWILHSSADNIFVIIVQNVQFALKGFHSFGEIRTSGRYNLQSTSSLIKADGIKVMMDAPALVAVWSTALSESFCRTCYKQENPVSWPDLGISGRIAQSLPWLRSWIWWARLQPTILIFVRQVDRHSVKKVNSTNDLIELTNEWYLDSSVTVSSVRNSWFDNR